MPALVSNSVWATKSVTSGVSDADIESGARRQILSVTCLSVRVYARLSVGTGLKHGIPLTKAAMLLTSPEIFECAEKRFSRRVGKVLAHSLLTLDSTHSCHHTT